MKYEWEKTVNLQEVIDAVNIKLPFAICLVGIVVAHVDNGEGAGLAIQKEGKVDIWLADVLKDGIADLDNKYVEALRREKADV